MPGVGLKKKGEDEVSLQSVYNSRVAVIRMSLE